jgi:cellulose synthase (UDP-forming)
MHTQSLLPQTKTKRPMKRSARTPNTTSRTNRPENMSRRLVKSMPKPRVQGVEPAVSAEQLAKSSFLVGHASKRMLAFNAIMATVYFCFITFAFRPGNHVLFYFLIVGEIFHLIQILGYCMTVWDGTIRAAFDPDFTPPVDIFITVCGEPVEIVAETVKAALAMDYKDFNVYILNDGLVAKKDNWAEIDAMANSLGIMSITRTTPGGAKAGNINHGLSVTQNPYFVIFDADMVPYPSFLKETMGYFQDPKMGFVQTPQYYKNHALNRVTDAAASQQALFFGPIMSGKNRYNAAFMCGSNMVLSREAILGAGGMCEFNIAEDFLTSLFVHENGWNSVYLPKLLVEGLSPEDFLSYYKQQFRWARGSLEVIFKYNPLLRRGLTWAQRIQYLVSPSYFLSGLVVVYDAILPLIFLFTGITAVHTTSMSLAFIFVPYIFLTFLTLQLTSNYSLTYQAMAFSLSSFFLQLRAIYAVLTQQKTAFSVTSKKKLEGNFLYLTTPHILYVIVALVGFSVAILRHGLSASLFANLAWVAINIVLFMPFIIAASPEHLFKRFNLSRLFKRFKNVRMATLLKPEVPQETSAEV